MSLKGEAPQAPKENRRREDNRKIDIFIKCSLILL